MSNDLFDGCYILNQAKPSRKTQWQAEAISKTCTLVHRLLRHETSSIDVGKLIYGGRVENCCISNHIDLQKENRYRL